MGRGCAKDGERKWEYRLAGTSLQSSMKEESVTSQTDILIYIALFLFCHFAVLYVIHQHTCIHKCKLGEVCRKKKVLLVVYCFVDDRKIVSRMVNINKRAIRIKQLSCR